MGSSEYEFVFRFSIVLILYFFFCNILFHSLFHCSFIPHLFFACTFFSSSLSKAFHLLPLSSVSCTSSSTIYSFFFYTFFFIWFFLARSPAQLQFLSLSFFRPLIRHNTSLSHHPRLHLLFSFC